MRKIRRPSSLRWSLSWRPRRRQPDGTQTLVRYTKVRAADLRVGNTVTPVIWDEAVTSTDGTVLYYKPWALFEGYQRQFSQFQPFLLDPQGADSSFVPFNSATRTVSS